MEKGVIEGCWRSASHGGDGMWGMTEMLTWVLDGGGVGMIEVWEVGKV